MIVLPTMGRPDKLKRFIDAYRATDGCLTIHVVLDEADARRYDDTVLPEHWKRCTVPAGTRLGDIFNLLFKAYPNDTYYGMVADDVVPETYRWDTLLRDACLTDKIAWGWDGLQNDALPVHPFIGGDLIRSLGWWAAPGLKHWFVDNVWKNLSVDLDAARYIPEVRMVHHHYLLGKAQLDRTYEEQPCHKMDQITYENFMRTEYPNTIQRIKDAGNISGGRIPS